MPKPGTLVAIDAEFVSLQLASNSQSSLSLSLMNQQEESEIRSDGTKKVLRPSILSLARVSVLRGNGPSAGKPFIDDYIHTSDVIVDYLTEYSGIRCTCLSSRWLRSCWLRFSSVGDLDPNFSTRILLPLKAVYKKLRLLIDLGCIFVGHGVTKDFRIISPYTLILLLRLLTPYLPTYRYIRST